MKNIRSLVQQHGTPLILFSENEFKRMYQNINSYLPNVRHHYALKPLALKECINIISECGGWLDVASIGELELVKETNPALIAKTIFTHPIKKEADIRKSLEYGVKTMVAENFVELQKILNIDTHVDILIRLAFPNEEALCNLSERYGAMEDKFKKLVGFCYANGINVIGCCFHVGSQMKTPAQHVEAIKECRKLYDWAFSSFGIKFKVLDIGGGFPAKLQKDDMDLKTFCAPIKTALDELFPDIEIWSEPGRCIAANCMIVITQVIGKVYKNDRMWYYLDEGVYGTFSGVWHENMQYKLYPFIHKFNKPVLSVFAGPTCDSVDVIAKDIPFQELQLGDYLFALRVGAYCWVSRTKFNLIEESKIIPFDFDIEEIEEFISRSECVFDLSQTD